MEQKEKSELLRALPSVDELLRLVEAEDGMTPRWLWLDAVRSVLEEKRKGILQGTLHTLSVSTIDWLSEVKAALSRRKLFNLRRVINATGVVLHTNLGRALLCQEALENLMAIAGHYSNLEFDLATGRRGSRYAPVVELLCRLTGAESALVVNNNAAAVFLALQTLAQGREVVVSRGQLVEIGGSFRIPDIMQSSGAILREVGTTNKTHPADYRRAINERTALLLKVHTSNYRIVGFTEEVPLAELVRIGHEHQLPVMEDLGSGNFLDLSRYGLTAEPTVPEVIKTGVDVVTFSGDKLLGGPQAGIIVGKKVYLDRIRTNPLNRALRIDKMTIAALEATLRLFLDEAHVVQQNPTLRMLTMPLEEIIRRAEHLRRRMEEVKGPEDTLAVLEDSSQVGGGAMPLQMLPTRVVAITSRTLSANELEEKFRAHQPPIIGRVHREQFLLDVRTIQEEEMEEVVQAWRAMSARSTT